MTPTYTGGQTYSIDARSSSTTKAISITPAGTATVALSLPSIAPTGSPAVYCGIGVAAASGNSCNLTVVGLHHLEVTTTASSGTTGTAVTYTIKACANADCSTLWTGGVTGNLSVSGAGLVVTYSNISGAFTIGAGSSSTTLQATIVGVGNATVALNSISPAASYYCGLGQAAASGNSCTFNSSLALHHLELTAASSTAVTCQPITYTVKACANAACSSLYTAGVVGSLTVSGPASVSYPSGQAFTIANGSSSTTISAWAKSTGTATAALSAVLPIATDASPTWCGMGAAAASGGSCAITMASSLLSFNVPNHASEVSQSVTVTAIKSNTDSSACLTAFASTTKNVTFACSYTNPNSGTRAVRVGGVALNAGNNAAAACDGSGRAVSLSFDASGVATTTVQYADVGQMNLSATYTGAGSDAGLTMAGSDAFIATPYAFSVGGPAAGNIRAGNAFSGTVTAVNYAGAATPNFGLETVAEGATLSFVRTKPSGTGAVTGVFSGSLGAFTSGAASASNLRYTEVGRGDVAAVLTSGSYLGTGAKVAGSTTGWANCAAEGGTCTLPTGATAYVAFGANGFRNIQTGVTGSVACTNAVFGDPIPGTAKTCDYLVTSGTSTGVDGVVGPFIPHNFTTEATNRCGGSAPGSFTYSGQPFTAVVKARNLAGDITQNYDGSANTSPNHAKAVTLSAGTNGGTGSFTNAAVAASSFTSGIATLTLTPAFTFTSKLTAPTSVTVRAVDTDSVTSSGFTEGGIALRSGRLKLFNAFGSERLQQTIAVQTQYWSSRAWVLNSADTYSAVDPDRVGCTHIPTGAVALSNYLDHKGAASGAWTTSVVAPVSISGGNGALTLSAPSPAGSVGSVDVAINLGALATDASCLANHPVTTGADRAWLRSRNGSTNSCNADNDNSARDPSARATFGVFAPETQRTVFTRELF